MQRCRRCRVLYLTSAFPKMRHAIREVCWFIAAAVQNISSHFFFHRHVITRSHPAFAVQCASSSSFHSAKTVHLSLGFPISIIYRRNAHHTTHSLLLIHISAKVVLIHTPVTRFRLTTRVIQRFSPDGHIQIGSTRLNMYVILAHRS